LEILAGVVDFVKKLWRMSELVK